MPKRNHGNVWFRHLGNSRYELNLYPEMGIAIPLGTIARDGPRGYWYHVDNPDEQYRTRDELIDVLAARAVQ